MQGYIVVITRNGSLGGRYPLTSTECLFGQSPKCDVRVYVANVARKHCLITALPNERAYIRNLSPSNTTLVNGIQIGATQYELQHADVITVGDRHFRWEYPFSARLKTPAKKAIDCGEHKSPTCMVQVPMSVFKNKRHSSPGVLRQNKIISITSQGGGEPDPKRRKTMHNITGLSMGNKLPKQVNKQLLAVTQPASSPKSFNTFRVLVKSASKRKSLIPISKTPKPRKKIISTKVRRAKSLSPQKLSPKQKSLLKDSKRSVSKIEPIHKISKLNTPPLKSVAKKLSLSTTSRKRLLSASKKSSSRNSPTKYPVAVALKRKSQNLNKGSKSSPENKVQAIVSLKDNSPIKTPRGRPRKTPRKETPSGKSLSSFKTPSPRGSISRSSIKGHSLEKSPKDKTPEVHQQLHTIKSLTPTRSPSTTSPKDRTPGKVGSKILQRSPLRKSSNTSPTLKVFKNSPSMKGRTPAKTPLYKPSNTPKSSAQRKSLKYPSSKASLSSLSAKAKTPEKSSKCRSPKTPKTSPTRNSRSPKTPQIVTPKVGDTPSTSRRGRPSKTPQASPTKTPASLAKSSLEASLSVLPLEDKTHEKSPRGRRSKTPQPTKRLVSPAKSLCVSILEDEKSKKSPRGRPTKTPQASPIKRPVSPANSLEASLSVALLEDKIHEKSPRGRPSKTPQIRPTKRLVSPAISLSVSTLEVKKFEKSPRGRPPKTPQVSPLKRSVTPAKSSPETSHSISLLEDNTHEKSLRGRPSKTPSVSPIRSTSPAKSQSPKEHQGGSSLVDTVASKRPRGRPPKTPKPSPTRRSLSPAKSPSKVSRTFSPLKEKTPNRTVRGRVSKTPQISPTRFESPASSPSKFSQSVSQFKEKISESQRKQGSRTPEISPTRKSVAISSKASFTGSPENTLTRTPRGRPSKTPKTSLSTSSTPATDLVKVSPRKNLANSLRSDDPFTGSFLSRSEVTVSTQEKTPKSNGKLSFNQTKESVTLPERFSLSKSFSKEAADDLNTYQSFGTSNETLVQTPSYVTKRTRRSALRSSLSSLKNVTTSSNKPLLLKSSSKKTEIAKLQVDSKQKYDTAAEAKAERAAKRLKMETPKSLTKNKKAAILVCHSPKSQKRPLFSEVLKSHLSTIKKNQAASAAVTSNAARRAARQIYYQQPLSLEVPKSFKFNSTGHANSPETIIITKTSKKTPVPKTRKGRKSNTQMETRTIEDMNLEGVPELFKTPKSIISSLKSASSVKKSQNIRVRFSLQNDVRSPSGRRSLVMQSGETSYFGSPIPSKKYIGTPRPPMRRISDTSLIHTSIMEESPLAQEIKTFDISCSKSPEESYDFSVYSPSSPTLQFSQFSDGSSAFARKSIDFNDSPSSPRSLESPKRKRSIATPDDSSPQLSQSSKQFSFASVRSYKSRNSSEFQTSPDGCARLSESDLFVESPVNSDVSQGSHISRKSRSRTISNTKDNEEIGSICDINISQIPLPHSPPGSKANLSLPIPSSIKSTYSKTSLRSTRSSSSYQISHILSVVESRENQSQVRKSRGQLLGSKGSKFVSPNQDKPSQIPSNQSSKKSSRSLNLSLPSNDDSLRAELPKRISSTPKVEKDSNLYSPVNSPISILDKRSLRSLGLTTSQNFIEESSTSTSLNEYQSFKTPLSTSGKKTRKTSTRMNASNAEILSPESQVPVAAVKPSTRKKLGESYSSASESISLPAFSISHDISDRSIDKSFAQKIMDSRKSSGLGQPRASRSSIQSIPDQSDLSLSSLSSSRRKRKSSSSTSIQSIDATTFDFTSAMTPKIPREMFVSPLDEVDDLTNVSGVKKILSPKGNSPVSNYMDVRGIKKLFKTPKTQRGLTDVSGVKRIMSPRANSPLSSYVDVKGVKRLLKTPQSHSPLANYASIEGIKKLFKHSPICDYTNVDGVKRLYSVSVEPNYMNVKGVRRIFKEAKVPNSPDVAGVEVLFESPRKLMDDNNQPSSSKPVGMVPPMSRHSSIETISEDLILDAIEYGNENNAETITINAESSSQTSLRRRALDTQQMTDKQEKLNTSVISSRKTRRKREDVKTIFKSADETLISEEVNNKRLEVYKANEKNTGKPKNLGNRTRGNRIQLEVTKNNFTNEISGLATVVQNNVRSTRRGKGRQLEDIEVLKDMSEQQQPSVSDIHIKTKTVSKISQLTEKTKSPGKVMIENGDISSNIKPSRGRTRRILHQKNMVCDEIPGFSEELKPSSQKKKEIKDKSEEKSELIGRRTRGRAKSTFKIENEKESPSSPQKNIRLGVLETNVQSSANSMSNNVMASRNKMKGSDSTETLQDIQSDNDNKTTRLRHEQTKVFHEKSETRTEQNKNIGFESDLGSKKNTRTKRGQRKQEKEAPLNLALPYSENNKESRRKRGRPNAQEVNKSPEAKQPLNLMLPYSENNNEKSRRKGGRSKAQEVNSKSPEAKKNYSKFDNRICDILTSESEDMPKKPSRSKKSDSSQQLPTKQSSLENSNKSKKEDKKPNSEDNLHDPNPASSSTQENHRVTRRKVQFDMCLTVYFTTPSSGRTKTNSSQMPKKSSPKKRATKTTLPATKAKASSKTRAISATSENNTPEKKVSSRRVTTKTKASPELKATLKTKSPTQSPVSPIKKVPVKKVTAKTRASTKLKAADKRTSPTLTNTPSKKEPAKKKSTRAKSPKLDTVVAKVATPTSKGAKPEKKVSAKKVTVKTKASSKLKAAAKRKSNTPKKSPPPPKRITRSRK